MNGFFLGTGLFLCFLMFLTLSRAVFGPTAVDRIMGVNLIGTKTVILLLVIGFLYDQVDMFVDIALAYALLNFIATIAAARYFQHRKDILNHAFTLRYRRKKA